MKAIVHIDVVGHNEGEFAELESEIDIPFVPPVGMSLQFDGQPVDKKACNEAFALGEDEIPIVFVARTHYRLRDQLLIIEAKLECRPSQTFVSAIGQWVNCMGFKEV